MTRDADPVERVRLRLDELFNSDCSSDYEKVIIDATRAQKIADIVLEECTP